MRKRLIVFLCIISLCMSLVTPAMAADVNVTKNEESSDISSGEEIHAETSYHINPLYADVISEEDLNNNSSEYGVAAAAEEEITYETDLNKIINSIRENMTNRTTEFTLYYAVDSELDEAFLDDWILVACQETENPKQGDYLRWHYVGSTCSRSWSSSSDGYKYTLQFTFTYYTDIEQENELDEKMDSVFSELGIDSMTSDYEKVKAIYTYIYKNVKYDEKLTKRSAYEGLVNGSTVCQGYSTLLYCMLRKAGISARVITGDTSCGDHAWNIIKLGKYYYNADVTWECEYSITDWQHFLKGSENFDDHNSADEYLTAEFIEAYPIATTDYVEGTEESEGTDSDTEETTVSVYIDEEAGSKLIDLEGNNLTDTLKKGTADKEYLVEAGTTLEFTVEVEEGYKLFMACYGVAEKFGAASIPMNEDQTYYSVPITEGPVYFNTYTEKLLQYEDVYEAYYNKIGFASHVSNSYFSVNESPSEEIVFNYLNLTDELNEYFDETTYQYSIDYDVYMRLAKKNFLNPPEMETYLAEKGYFNEETYLVTYAWGGYGANWRWITLDTEEKEDSFVLTGLFLDDICESTTEKVENQDYYNIEIDGEVYSYNISDIVRMTLVKDGTQDDYLIKLAAYEQADYYIIDDILYTYNEERTEISAYNKIETVSDEDIKFNYTGTYMFDGNDELWYKADEGFTWSCETDDGYQASVMVETENNTTIEYASGKVSANSGKVLLTGELMAEITVNSEHATVNFEGLSENNGVYLFRRTSAIIFSISVEDGYSILSVNANNTEITANSFGKYQVYPEFEPLKIEVLTEKNAVIEPDTTLPVAVIAPEDIIGTTGEAITFSGVNSMDNVEIASYEWDFGDGSTGTEAICKHTYTDGGTYTVTLKVTDTSGNEATAVKEVFVYGITGEDAEYALMTIKTIDGYTEGTPVIGNVNVQITAETEDHTFETMVLTDESGVATVVVPRTSITVAAIADGYSATSRVVNVIPDEEGKFSHTLSLSPAGISLVDGSIEVEEMTLEEIKDAGIEIENPENQQVVRTELQISFEPHIGTSFDVGIYSDGEGNVLGGFNIGEWITVTGSQEDDPEEDDSGEGSSGSSGSASGSGGSGGYSSSGSGRKVLVLTLSEKMFLVIHGETHWLKEMYNVDLIVLNNSRVEDLTDCVAELELPEGLSLAKMMDEQQSATVELGTIEKYSNETGYHSRTHTWYVCGDEMGEYNITANVSGNAVSTDGSTSAFEVSFTTTNPVRVYAGSALHLTIRPQDVCYQDEKYYVNYSLKNVSDTTLYNLSLAFTFTEQYELARMTDGTEEYTYIDNERFGDEMYIEIEEFEPGQSVDFMFCTTTWFEDDFMEGAASIIPLTDAEYRFRDAFLTFAESSTTTIPYTIEFWEVEKDGFWEWIDGECRKWEEDLLGNVAEGFFVTLIDSRACKKIPVTKYGVKVMKYVIGENTHHDIESEMVVTPGNGVEIVESGDDVRQRSTYTMFTEANADTYNSDTNVVVYTDVPYEMSEDGKSMVISEDATLYIARVEEGEANLSVTTCYYPYGITQKDTYTRETITYDLVSDPDAEYSELLADAVSVEMDSLETTEFSIHYKDTETVTFPALYMAEDGYYHLTASNAVWSIEGDDTEGLEIVDGVLYISKEAKEGTYTVKVSLEDTDVVESQEITLTKIECPHDTMGEWTTVTSATYTKEGKEVRTCTVCDDYSEERTIPLVTVTNIVLDVTNITLPGGEEITLHASCTPIVPAEGELTWTSSDESVAKVDSNGKVTTIGDGTAKIIAAINGSDIEAVCEVTVITAYTPEVPANFKAVLSGGHDDVKLTWSASEHATGYYVYYKKSSSSSWSSAKSTTATSYTLNDLADNITYNFKVIAYHQNGDNIYYDSNKASTVSLMTKKNVPAPTTVKAVLYGYDDVKVTWTKSSGAAGYNVYYKKSSASSYTYLTATTGLSVKKANLADGVKYTFKVVPYYKNGTTKAESYYSKTASVYTLKKLSAPTVTKYSATKIKISWTNISGETGYQISQSTSKTGTSIISTYATTSGTSKTFTVTRNKNYYYKVRAYKTVSGRKIYGPWSSVTAYNLRYVASQSTVKVSLYGYDDVKLTWSKVTGANTYDVYYKKSSASSYTKLGSTTGISYKKANLADGVKYTFKVVPSYKSSGKILAEGAAKTVSIYTLKKLPAPTVTKSSSTKVKVTWKNISGETGYQISQSTSKTGTNILSTYATTSGKSKTITAKKGTTYYYKVRAYKTVGSKKIYGPWSDVTKYKLK